MKIIRDSDMKLISSFVPGPAPPSSPAPVWTSSSSVGLVVEKWPSTPNPPLKFIPYCLACGERGSVKTIRVHYLESTDDEPEHFSILVNDHWDCPRCGNLVPRADEYWHKKIECQGILKAYE